MRHLIYLTCGEVHSEEYVPTMNKSAAMTKLNNSNNNGSNMCTQAQASSSRDNAQQLGRVESINSKSSSGGDSGAGPPTAEDNTQAAQQPAQEVQVRTIRVPTFAPLRQIRAPVRDINELRWRDPFHYYSDQARRMTHLLHNQGDINHDDPQQQQHQQAGERRTRISFEVHPSLMLDPLIFGMNMDGAEGEGGNEGDNGGVEPMNE